jgi:hypothetical protein
MRIRSLAAAGLVLVAVYATACSGGSGGSGALGGSANSGAGSGGSASGAGQPSAASNSSINVCALMSAKKASKIVGVHYSKAAPAHDMCTYTPTNAPIGMYIIIFTNSGGAAAWKEQLGTMEEDGGGKPFTLAGAPAGDKAEGDGTEISVQAGSDIIDVHGGDPLGTGAAGANSYPKSVAIAKVIASQLH